MSTPITEALPLPPIYYQSTGPLYLVQDQTGKWIGINETSARLRIKASGFSAEAFDENHNNQVDNCVVAIQDSQNVAYAGPLAGYQSGLHEIRRKQVLVTESPRLLQACPGEWPLLNQILEGMLNDPQGDQRPYLYGWLKLSLVAYRTGLWSPGQVFAFAGPVRSGKSLLQGIITELFGGRAAKPYLYMTGRTAFNADLFGAEHLMVEDEAESIDIRARRHFGAKIKEVAVNVDQHCHGKNKTALTLTPIWRMTMSLNDEPERMQVLPPLDADVADKLTLCRVRQRELPMPTETPEEKRRFREALSAELPAFMAFLEQYEIPAEMRCRRFGIVHYHHPDLVEAMDETRPETRLLSLIDQVLFAGIPNREPWVGGSIALQQLLCDGHQWLNNEARRLLCFSSACGSYLRGIADDPRTANRITSRRVHGQTEWTIHAPAPVEREPGR